MWGGVEVTNIAGAAPQKLGLDLPVEFSRLSGSHFSTRTPEKPSLRISLAALMALVRLPMA